jgi:hypothetical protein
MAIEFKMADKYNRMILAYDKLIKVGTNTGNSISLSEAKETAEDFFSHCYHFKDWLIKEYPHLKQAIEKHISSNFALSLAADHCNAFKHGGLDKPPRSGHQLDAINQHTKIDPTPAGFQCSAKVVLTVGGQTYQAIPIAQDCVKAWKNFMRANNIKIPSH